MKDKFNKYQDNMILNLKRALYHALLTKKEMTDNEIDIAYYLAKDEDIQYILREAKKNDNNPNMV